MFLLYPKKIENLTPEQKNFIFNSLSNSFPKIKISFKKNKIYIYKKEHLTALKNSIDKLYELSKEIGSKKILFNQKNKTGYFKDPIKNLIKKKQIIRISEGLFQYQGDFLKIFRAANKYFYNLAVNHFKAVDQENPVLWPLDLYKKIDYFSDFPQQILMISGLKKNYSNYKKFSKKYASKNKFSGIETNHYFKPSKYGLQPAVCDNCYYGLSNLKSYKNTVYTTFNKVFRDEKSDYDNLDRLISFTVRDIMFVGDEKFVLQTRNKLFQSIKKFLIISKLDCSIEVANDPFFISNINKKIFQDTLDLKYEILAKAPFLKSKIAIGSINFHLNTFGKAFNISNKGKSIYSGCIGIGFERLLLAFYSQYGTKISNWPKSLKNLLKINL